MNAQALNGLVIFLGSGLGGWFRWWLSGWIASRAGETFPWGTLVVNVSGCLVIGLFAGLTGPDGRYMTSPTFRQFFMIGICGGYTTFSSFSWQTLNLMMGGEWLKSGANVMLSVALCLAAVWLGHAVAVFLGTPRTG